MPPILTATVSDTASDALRADDRRRCAEYDRRLQTQTDRRGIAACLADLREWLDLDELLLLNSSLSYSDQFTIAAGHDPAWLGLYMREGFVHIDPIVNAIIRGHRFFPRRPLMQLTVDRSSTPGDPNDPLMRRLIEAAKDFDRPTYGYAGGEIVGDRFLLLSAPATRNCQDERRSRVLDALFPSLMRTLSRQTSASLRAALSRREAHMLELLAEGLSDAQIAGHLAISQATVRFHLQNLFLKLQARNRCHAIALAYRYGHLAPH